MWLFAMMYACMRCCCVYVFYFNDRNMLSFHIVYACMCCCCVCVFFSTAAPGGRLIWCMRVYVVVVYFVFNDHPGWLFDMWYAFTCCFCVCVFVFFSTNASGGRLIWCMRLCVVVVCVFFFNDRICWSFDKVYACMCC